jgi:biotin transporter BioY
MDFALPFVDHRQRRAQTTEQGVTMKGITIVLFLALLLANRTQATAQNGAYTLTGGVVASGAATLSAGAYTVEGALGQPGLATLQGGEYALGGGFFGGGLGEPTPRVINLPFVGR